MGEHIEYRTKLVVANAGLYCIEVRIPADLIEFVGKIVFFRSLATKDEEEAHRLLPEYRQQIVEALEGVRRARDASANPAIEADSPDTPLGEAIRRVHLLFPETRFRLEEPQVRLLMSAADRFILDFGMPIKRYSRDYWRLCRRIRKLQIEAPAPEFAAHSYSASDRETTAAPSEMSFGQLIDAFEAEVGVDWRSHNRENWRHALRIASDFFGSEKRVASLTRRDFIGLRGVLEDLAPLYWAYKDFRGLPIATVARKCRERNLPRRAMTTINTMLRMYRHLMEWAAMERIIDQNCALGLQRRERHEFVKKVVALHDRTAERNFHIRTAL